MMWQNTKIEFLSFSKIINHFRCVNFYVFISSENRTEKIIAIPSNCAYFYTIASDNIKAVDHKIISTCLYNFSWERKNQMESVTISEKQKMMRREREKKRESKKKYVYTNRPAGLEEKCLFDADEYCLHLSFQKCAFAV